jgi:hypothetical protein
VIGIAMTRLAAGALLIAQLPPAPVTESPGEVLTTDQALALFRQLCVDPLPSPQRFVEAMNTSGLRWQKVAKTPEEVYGLGNSWRSARGMITYHVPHYESQGSPACHFEWRPEPGYDHAAVAAAVAAALGLPKGKNIGSRREPQMRWETTRRDRMMIRVFLTSIDNGADGWTVRFSISRLDPNALIPREVQVPREAE